MLYFPFSEATPIHATLDSSCLNGANLNNARLSYASLYNADLHYASLENTDLYRANFTRANFTRANLKDADMRRAILTKALLVETDLTDVNLRKSVLTNAHLTKARLCGADLGDADLSSAILDETNFFTVSMDGAKLDGALFCKTIGNGREIKTFCLKNAHINVVGTEVWINDRHHSLKQWLDFDATDVAVIHMDIYKFLKDDDSLSDWLQRCQSQLLQVAREQKQTHKITQEEVDDIYYSHSLWIQGKKDGAKADLSRCDLTNLEYFGFGDSCNWSDADFNSANFEGSNLSYANFKRCNFANTNLQDADLSKSDLENAYLINADLSKSDLSCANLTGANLKGADLRGADLSWVIGNGREIVTIQVDALGDYSPVIAPDPDASRINITDQEVWIDGCHHTWDQWLSFDDATIETILPKFMGEKKQVWWGRWKPVLSHIIEQRKNQEELTFPPGFGSPCQSVIVP